MTLSDAEDGVELEACVLFFYYTYWMSCCFSAVLDVSLSDVVRPYVQNLIQMLYLVLLRLL